MGKKYHNKDHLGIQTEKKLNEVQHIDIVGEKMVEGFSKKKEKVNFWDRMYMTICNDLQNSSWKRVELNLEIFFLKYTKDTNQ